MADVFVERTFSPPLTGVDESPATILGAMCSDLFRIEWRESFLDRQGRRRLCRFTAPDAESVRVALRQSGAGFDRVWTGTMGGADGAGIPDVVGERSFAAPLSGEELRALVEAGAGWRAAYRVRLARTMLARDRTRLICLYRAADAASVRAAEARAGRPLEIAWRCRWAGGGPAGPDLGQHERPGSARAGNDPGFASRGDDPC